MNLASESMLINAAEHALHAVAPALAVAPRPLHAYPFGNRCLYAYERKYDFAHRRACTSRLRTRYPQHVPVVVECASSDAHTLPPLQRTQFLVPEHTTMPRFLYELRRYFQGALMPTAAIFLFIEDTLVPTGALLRDVHARYAREDGMLYMSVCGEATFGAIQ